MRKHIILFLAANPLGTDRLALDEEARAIQEELERSGHGDKFELVTRWAARPLDLLRHLRKLKPTVVHFSGHGSHGELQLGAGPRRHVAGEPEAVDSNAVDGDPRHGLFFQGPDGTPQLVSTAALEETFGAAGSSVKLVVLNACYSEAQAEALIVHVGCVVGVAGPIREDAARSFAVGFYGGLGERQSVAAAHQQGRAAISLDGLPYANRPQLKVRTGLDAERLILAEAKTLDGDAWIATSGINETKGDVTSSPLGSSDAGTTAVIVSPPQAAAPARPIPLYADAEVRALSQRLEDARTRRQKLRDSAIATDQVDREILELRRQLREGGQLRAGDTLSDGRYLLVKVVGRGGFAAIWEAHDIAEGRRVAIKVLHANLAGDLLRRERFFRGARVMMDLEHPAVVRVLDPKEEDGGFYYFVMEFVAGGNLREAVLEQRVQKDDVLPLMLRVGDALATAHARGMIHRDVKPANILLDEQGNAKLTDFDLVGAHDTTGGTRTGALGTIVYAAPECLEKPQAATARADVYSLGMTAIFCLVGRELLLSTFRNPESTITKLDCSMHVKNVLRQAVSWEPNERFADATAMMIELRNEWNPRDRPTRPAVELTEVPRVVGLVRSENAPSLVPALTIVSHPFSHRTGEQFLLEAIATSKEVLLSRNEPHFGRRGQQLGGPLSDPFVGKKPIRFAPYRDGGVELFVDPDSTSVLAGSLVDGSTVFTLDDLVHGVPLELAGRVVLLLHLVERNVEDAADSLGMVGASAGMRRVRAAIERVVDLAVPVLIRGETGTGKELMARAIHDHGSRSGPFVSVNLGAIPRELASAELFGVTRGAYTGSMRDREGLFRTAHGGTLFLDEIGEAPPEVQVTLLRALDHREIYPVGADRPVTIDVRLIAATDADLEHQILKGRFKAPLLHRLASYEVRIPPLRERREDIGPLFYHFAHEELATINELHRLSPKDAYTSPWLPAHIAAQLVRYSWPGNIRQLRNLVRQLVIGSRGFPQLRLADELGVPWLSRNIESVPPSSPPESESRRDPSTVTEPELLDALRACAWDLKAAADRVRIPRPSIYDLIERSPNIRTAGDLSAAEITQCFRACAGDLDAMVAQLQVSKRALSRRVKELGLAGVLRRS